LSGSEYGGTRFDSWQADHFGLGGRRQPTVRDLEGSAERSASGLESRTRCKPKGSIPLLSAWKMWPVGATSPAKGDQVKAWWFDSTFFRWMGAGTHGRL